MVNSIKDIYKTIGIRNFHQNNPDIYKKNNKDLVINLINIVYLIYLKNLI